jgi:hypothetical protein
LTSTVFWRTSGHQGCSQELHLLVVRLCPKPHRNRPHPRAVESLSYLRRDQEQRILPCRGVYGWNGWVSASLFVCTVIPRYPHPIAHNVTQGPRPKRGSRDASCRKMHLAPFSCDAPHCTEPCLYILLIGLLYIYPLFLSIASQSIRSTLFIPNCCNTSCLHEYHSRSLVVQGNISRLMPRVNFRLLLT